MNRRKRRQQLKDKTFTASNMCMPYVESEEGALYIRPEHQENGDVKLNFQLEDVGCMAYPRTMIDEVVKQLEEQLNQTVYYKILK